MKTTYKIQGTEKDIDRFNENVDWLWLWKKARATITQHREDENTLCVSLSSGIPPYLKELRGYEFDEFEEALTRACEKFNVEVVEKI